MTCRQLGRKCASCRDKAGHDLTAFGGKFRQHSFDLPDDDCHDVSMYLRGQNQAIIEELRRAVDNHRYVYLFELYAFHAPQFDYLDPVIPKWPKVDQSSEKVGQSTLDCLPRIQCISVRLLSSHCIKVDQSSEKWAKVHSTSL